MLSDGPALSSPTLGVRTPSHSAPARALQSPVAIPDNGYVTSQQQPEKRAQTPGSPSQPSQQQPQHGLNAPRPSLSPLSEYHSGFADEDLGSPCPSPSPFSLANHRRQHSFPNLLPLAFRSRTPSPTRKAHARSPSEQMPYTGDKRNNERTAAGSLRGAGGLASWFSGTAGAASALGLSLPGEARSYHGPKDAATPGTTPTRLRRGTTGPGSTASDIANPKSTVTTASRFMSAISSRFNPTTPASPALSPNRDVDDELCGLSIEARLFPHGSPVSDRDRDPFSPAAFKNLQMNAIGLLTKMQTAYRERVATLRDLEAERSAQRDELEEAETRAQHLKMQLEGMARKAQEHERAIKSLMEELAAERRARADERAAAAAAGMTMTPLEGASMVSEDLGVDEDRLRRRKMRSRRKSWKSGGGGEGRVSCGEDTDEDEGNESAESESVFSRCRSPALSHVPPQSPPPTAAHAAADTGSMVRVGGGAGTPHARNPGTLALRQKPGQQISAFQKILKGISGDSGEDSGANGCANCKGQDASVAWDTVSLLRDENRHLKRRVGELEVAVEGALDLVNGVGL